MARPSIKPALFEQAAALGIETDPRMTVTELTQLVENEIENRAEAREDFEVAVQRSNEERRRYDPAAPWR